MTALDDRVALGFGDPGGLNPITGLPPNPVTDRVYDLLPEMYRTADADQGWALYGYIDAVCSTLLTPTAIADRIVTGQLTDPSLTDDAWIPWLAQVVGILGIGMTVAQKRARLANITNDPSLGSRGYLATLTQSFLSGTRSVVITPAPPWGIQIRVRASELTLPGATTLDELTTSLYATHRIPAGFVLQVVSDEATWAQIQSVLPTWAEGENKMWKVIDSMGLTGSGFASAATGWAARSVGVAGP